MFIKWIFSLLAFEHVIEFLVAFIFLCVPLPFRACIDAYFMNNDSDDDNDDNSKNGSIKCVLALSVSECCILHIKNVSTTKLVISRIFSMSLNCYVFRGVFVSIHRVF